jgi:TRAP-type C4-dicarboxylate transport system substrate-binding protein
VDGVTTVWEAFSQIPVDKLKYITEAPLFTNAFWVAANPKSWAKISPQDQETIWRECCGLAGSLMEGNVFDLAEKPAREMTKHWEYTRLSPEELERWRTLIHPIHDKYIAALEKRGLPAKPFYDDLLGMLQKNAKYTPVIK